MADVNKNVTDSILLALGDAIPSLTKTTPSTLVDYLIAGETIFPSGYDIAAIAGDGITLRERSLSDNWLGLLTNNFTSSGMTIPPSSATLSITIPLGVACLAGRYVSVPAKAVTVSPSVVSYIFLKVTRDANLNVTGAYYEVNTTSLQPVDATPIATCTASGTAITSTTDARLLGPRGVILLASGTSWIVPAGIYRIFTEVFGASGGGGGSSGTGAGGTSGGNGGSGGTTTFDVISANGGGGGGNGPGQGPAHQSTGAGDVVRTGGGMPGGIGATSPIQGGDGLNGANGCYAASCMSVTPGTTISMAIGSAGSAGAAGAGATPGFAGRAGLAGRIVVHY